MFEKEAEGEGGKNCFSKSKSAGKRCKKGGLVKQGKGGKCRQRRK